MLKDESMIKSVTLLSPDLFVGKRGYFYEKHNRKVLSTYKVNFVQENISLSMKGTITGVRAKVIFID
jgi:dTDP-4-dehydrorhamnose 3,5-epimerase-like enzyme